MGRRVSSLPGEAEKKEVASGGPGREPVSRGSSIWTEAPISVPLRPPEPD